MRVKMGSLIRNRLLKIVFLICITMVVLKLQVGLNKTRCVGPTKPLHGGNVVHRFDVYSNSCTEKHNVVFLKTHKTGSSTIANIMQRFGHSRDLNFALPRKKPGHVRYNYFGDVGDTISTENTMPSKPNKARFNILYNHVIFNSSAFERLFPSDTFYFTILRHPLAQFQSAVLYFIHQEDVYRAATNNISAYLENPAPYEPTPRYLSFTDNRQALDLGIPPPQVRHKDYITHYMKMLNQTYDFVMIMEYFDESLIMLKRRLCWKMKDVLYIRKNSGYRNVSLVFSANDKRLHRKWALADYILYDFFHEKFVFDLKMDPSIIEETFHFRQILLNTQNFCLHSNDSRIRIGPSQWNKPFYVTSLDCVYLRLGELQFLNKLLHST